MADQVAEQKRQYHELHTQNMALDKEATTWRHKYEESIRSRALEIIQLNTQHTAAIQRLERQIAEIKDAIEEGLA